MPAQGKLGYLYAAGIGVTKDLAKAYAWLKLAVENGDEQAKKDLKRLEGIITDQDKQAGEDSFNRLKAMHSDSSRLPEF